MSAEAARKLSHVQQRFFGGPERVYVRAAGRRCLDVVLTFRVSPDEAEKVCRLAKKQKLTVSEVSRKIIVASASRLLK